MTKVFFYHFGWGLLGYIIVEIISLVLTVAIGMPVKFSLIFGIVLGVILSLIASGIIVLAGKSTYFYDSPKGLFQKLWYSLTIKNNKKISIWQILLMLLPFIAIAAIFAFFAATQISIISQNQYNQDEILIENMLLTVVLLAVGLMNSAIYWFLYAFFILCLYGESRCERGCGNVMCLKFIIEEDPKTYTHVDSKTKYTRGTIGAVYVDNKKIGEIKDYTGSYTMQRERKTSYQNTICYCVFCHREKTFTKMHNETSQWHRIG